MTEAAPHQTPGQGEEEAPDSALTTFFNTFFSPTQAFESIRRKPRWLLPLVFGLPLILASQLLAVERIGARNLARQQLGFIEQLGLDIPEERRAEMLDDMEQSQRYGPIYGSIFWIVGPLIIAGLLYIGVMAMGGDIRYYTTFGMAMHALGAYLIVVSLLTILVLLVSPTPEELNIQNLVATNPGFLIDQTESPVLFVLASSLDLTSLYFLFLLALGLSTISVGVSIGLAWGILIFYWVIWVMIKLIPALIFG